MDTVFQSIWATPPSGLQTRRMSLVCWYLNYYSQGLTENGAAPTKPMVGGVENGRATRAGVLRRTGAPPSGIRSCQMSTVINSQ